MAGEKSAHFMIFEIMSLIVYLRFLLQFFFYVNCLRVDFFKITNAFYFVTIIIVTITVLAFNAACATHTRAHTPRLAPRVESQCTPQPRSSHPPDSVTR